MSNTATKVNRFIALGYTFWASCPDEDGSHAHSSKESCIEENPITYNEIKEDDILPINNQILQTVNVTKFSGGLRI
jgi:hypothetical protein